MTEMKSWQKGYELDYLLKIEAFYKDYNTFSCSPFSEVKKHRIAISLKDGTHKMYTHEEKYCAMFNMKTSKAKSRIVMYPGVEIGVKQPGDVTITNLAWIKGNETHTADLLTIINEPTWLYIWAEDKAGCDMAELSGFSWVGTKVTTFAEIYSIYFRESRDNSLFEGEKREHTVRSPAEDYCVEKTNIAPELIKTYTTNLTREVNELENKYTNHYSNYNKDKSWSALALRGYTSDPAFITKPIEMGKKWKKDHENMNFQLQDTSLRAILPHVEGLIDLLPGVPHRIRLMKLKAGGELSRHTDQVDPDLGVTDGKLMRFHLPLETNEGVKFTSWGVDGLPKEVHMALGSCWYLDIRKPHMAVNKGDTDRIHLVIDIEVNENVRQLIKA